MSTHLDHKAIKRRKDQLCERGEPKQEAESFKGELIVNTRVWISEKLAVSGTVQIIEACYEECF